MTSIVFPTAHITRDTDDRPGDVQQSEAASGGQHDEVQLESPVRRAEKHAQVSFENGPESASSAPKCES